MKRIYLAAALLFASSAIFSQTTKEELFETPEKTGGVYYAYPSQDIVAQTPVPKGYEPFYVSHYGRHGSRYLISDGDYKGVLDLLEDAKKNNALTPLGLDAYNRLTKVWEEAQFRGGDLSPLGVRQHRGIAERLYTSFPQIFTDDANITARSTTVVRCVLSMDAFCERLKELNSNLYISRDASEKYVKYLNYHPKEAIDYRSAKDTWREQHRKYEKSRTNPERLTKSLFSDDQYVIEKVNPEALMWGLYWIASDMQNMETEASFYDLFEKQELFDLWDSHNYKLYVNDGNSALNGGVMMNTSKVLLKNILDSADEIIKSEGNGATLRFGHDGNVIPLTMILHLENCYNSVSEPTEFYKAWSDFKVVPMAANVQIIFFKKKGSDDILVKFLHNEKETTIPPVKSDILPYYHWKDIKAFYSSLLNK